MKKYMYSKGNNQPSEDRINQYKDFNKLLESYQGLYSYEKATRPLYRDKKLLGLIILIGIVLLALFLSENDEKKNRETGNSRKTEIKAD